MNHHLNEFCRTTRELLASEQVRSMGRWKHHGHITTLDHSLFVAYWSYRVARKFGWDEAAAARADCSTICTCTTPRTSLPTPACSALTTPAPRPETRQSSRRSLKRSATLSCPTCGRWAASCPDPGGLAGGPGGHPVRHAGAGAPLSPRPSAGADGGTAPFERGSTGSCSLLTDI